MKHHSILKFHSEQYQNGMLLVVTYVVNIVSAYDFTK